MTTPRITFRPTSVEQDDEIEAYAVVKGHKNASAYALYAAVTMMSKNPLTSVQRVIADKIIAERQKARQRYS